MSRSPKKVRVIYGGTFDPFHQGHQAICNAILSHELVDELRVIPCAVPALKSQAQATAAQRLAMLSAWQSTHEQSHRIIVDDQELARRGPSYSALTLRSLQANDPDSVWVFALGADAWNSLTRWYTWQDLIKLTRFWVFDRKGDVPANKIEQVTVCDDLQGLVSAKVSHVWFDDNVQLSIASSALRKDRKSLIQSTPASIRNYILENGLYEPNT